MCTVQQQPRWLPLHRYHHSFNSFIQIVCAQRVSSKYYWDHTLPASSTTNTVILAYQLLISISIASAWKSMPKKTTRIYHTIINPIGVCTVHICVGCDGWMTIFFSTCWFTPIMSSKSRPDFGVYMYCSSSNEKTKKMQKCTSSWWSHFDDDLQM